MSDVKYINQPVWRLYRGRIERICKYLGYKFYVWGLFICTSDAAGCDFGLARI